MKQNALEECRMETPSETLPPPSRKDAERKTEARESEKIESKGT
jgi:hypothetical protein